MADKKRNSGHGFIKMFYSLIEKNIKEASFGIYVQQDFMIKPLANTHTCEPHRLT